MIVIVDSKKEGMRRVGDFHKQDEGGEIHGSGNLNFPTLLNVFLHLSICITPF
jgi:hypothetical protein